MGAVTEITSTVAPASNCKRHVRKFEFQCRSGMRFALDSRAFWMALSVSGYLVERTCSSPFVRHLHVHVCRIGNKQNASGIKARDKCHAPLSMCLKKT